MKHIFLYSTVLSAFMSLYACNDKIEVQQAFDYSLSSWHLQSEIALGEEVEIRLTLKREDNFKDAEYYVGYIQMEGRGEVYDRNGILLVNRELHSLSEIAGIDTRNPMNQVFTLYYKNTGDKKAVIKFVVADNFSQERELTVSFNPAQSSE